LEGTASGQTHWSPRGLAQASGLSGMTISRIGRAFGFQLNEDNSSLSAESAGRRFKKSGFIDLAQGRT